MQHVCVYTQTNLQHTPYWIVLGNTHVTSSQWSRHVFVGDMLASQWSQACKRIGVCPISLEHFVHRQWTNTPTHTYWKGKTRKTLFATDTLQLIPARLMTIRITEWSLHSPTRIIEGRWEGKMREWGLHYPWAKMDTSDSIRRPVSAACLCVYTD